MRRASVLLISLVIFGGAIASAVLVYVMTQGVGCCRCYWPVRGKLLKFHISDNNRTVKFVISLKYPDRVDGLRHIQIALNLSGNLEKLKFNSSADIWKSGEYSASIYDLNGNGVVDSGDYLIVHSNSKEFTSSDYVRIEVVGYESYLSGALGGER